MERLYGINADAYEEMVSNRQGRCDLCRLVPGHKLHVEHDHDTGVIRGLCCSACNNAIADFEQPDARPRRLGPHLERLGIDARTAIAEYLSRTAAQRV